MKKFIGRIILLTVFTVGFLLLVNTICLHSNIYKNGLANQNTLKFENVPTRIMIANMGSSHGMDGFCYENINITAFNFALSSQSLVYDSNILGFYHENLCAGATVFIPISFFSFYSDELKKEDFVSQNARYYTFLDKEHIRAYDTKYAFLSKYIWILTRPPDKLFNDLINGRYELAPMQNYNNSAAKMGKDELQAEGLEAWNRHWKSVREHKDYEDREKENIAALVDMIDFCKTKGFVPVLVTTPFLSEYSRYYPKAFLDSFGSSTLFRTIC